MVDEISCHFLESVTITLASVGFCFGTMFCHALIFLLPLSNKSETNLLYSRLLSK
jgi:hypothetical protein